MRIRFGTFTLDFESRQLTSAGQEIHLEPKAFELLSALVLERPKALSKADLQERLWPGTFVAEANLSNLVAEIRAALGDPARAPKFVRTAHGFGYAFCGDAVTLTGPGNAPPVREPPESSDGIETRADTGSPPPPSSRVPWLVAGVLAVGLITTIVIERRRDGGLASAAGPVQFTIGPPEKTSFGGAAGAGTGIATQVSVSPDGRNIVFVAGEPSAYKIWLRPVATLAAAPIQGPKAGLSHSGRLTAGLSVSSRLANFGKFSSQAAYPFHCVTRLAGGAEPGAGECDPVQFNVGDSPGGLLRVTSAGGVPTIVTTLDPADGEDIHRWPYFLPDGRHFIYTAVTGACCPASKPSLIRIGSLDKADAPITLFQAESSVAYASGHLFFARDKTLMARPFDVEAHELKGDPFPLAEHVGPEQSRYVAVSVSENGTLVYGRAGPDWGRS